MNKHGSLPALAILAVVIFLGMIVISMFFTENSDEKETMLELVGAVRGNSNSNIQNVDDGNNNLESKIL